MRTEFISPLLALALSACSAFTGPEVTSAPDLPPMRWDHRAEADDWTETTLAALSSHGMVLPALLPSDVGTWCPAYPQATLADRKAFWSGLFSALAKHESTWNPAAVGGGGRWFGLVQIAPATARGHGCRVTSGEALKDGAANLACGVRIAANQVPKRGSISGGMRDWGPFHSASKRAEMAAWTRAQPYCRAE